MRPIKYNPVNCETFHGSAVVQQTDLRGTVKTCVICVKPDEEAKQLLYFKARYIRTCGMTLVLPVISHRPPFTMDECFADDEQPFSIDDVWGNTSAEISFLCNSVMEEDIYAVNGKGIKRKDLCDGNTLFESDFALDEQRRVIIQVSFEKLRQLEDPESSLRRSVLINNTLKMLHGQVNCVSAPYCFGERVNAFNFAEDVDRSRKRFRVSNENMHKTTINKDQMTEGFIGQNCVTNGCERCILPQVQKTELDDDVFEPELPSLPNAGENDGLKSDRESMFGDLDSMFHSFVCALEG